MAMLDALGNIPSADVFGSLAMNGDEYVRCRRCGYGGCDVRVAGCGCTLHARCTVMNGNGPLTNCPQCMKPTSGLVLLPQSFREVDDAKKTIASEAPGGRRSRKRKNPSADEALEEKNGYVSNKRTGRWTSQEMAYCDKLVATFQAGQLPLVDGVKLNEFLGGMLKSKQSRLTKKMKNAKLSTKTFERGVGHIPTIADAREFSELEESFFQSITCPLQRAEIKFHMQKEWREKFSRHCVANGQPLDADAWLSSVEEMDRRATRAKDAARLARRKLMMGHALRADSKNPEQGVFIENPEIDTFPEDEEEAARLLGSPEGAEAEELLNLLSDDNKTTPVDSGFTGELQDVSDNTGLTQSAPFLSKAVSYMQRHNVPFEHVDLWVPSFVQSNPEAAEADSSCRLCYAGSATVETQVGPDGKTGLPLSADHQFNFHAFGDYSQKFSFDVGCGLPGRVYHSGLPTWEQSVQNAPHHHFERCGGAVQWGIKTVVGIPIASPNVGRIVVTLYSRHDREKDQELVGRLTGEFTRLMPSPRWKLVVDVGEPDPELPMVDDDVLEAVATETETETLKEDETRPSKDSRLDEVISLLGEYMPSDPASPLASYLPGFMSLRLMLLRPSKSPEDEEMIRTILGSYSSYSGSGRSRQDIALNLSRDFTFLSQHTQAKSQAQPFRGLGPSMIPSSVPAPGNVGFHSFGLPPSGGTASLNASFQGSPALAPIGPGPMSNSGAHDVISIVST